MNDPASPLQDHDKPFPDHGSLRLLAKRLNKLDEN